MPRPAKKASPAKDSTANLGFETAAVRVSAFIPSAAISCRVRRTHRHLRHNHQTRERQRLTVFLYSSFILQTLPCLAIRGIEADSGKENADTFRYVQHPDLRADYVLTIAERDSASSTAKPHRRACRRQDNPMPFNDSDTALRGSAFLQSEAKPQVVSETKGNFRKDDDVLWQPSGARQIAKGSPQGERGGVHQLGVPPKGNANFAWAQHFIHHLAKQGTVGFVLANGASAS